MAHVPGPVTPRSRGAALTALTAGVLTLAASATVVLSLDVDRGLSASDWFGALWSLLLIPLTWLFGHVLNRRLERRAGAPPRPASPQSVFETARAAAAADATATASAQARASATARADAAAGRAGDGDDLWEQFLLGLLTVAALVTALSVMGVFFAGVRVVATSFALALYAVVAGYSLACMQTLRRQGALDAEWLGVLALAGCICATAFGAGVVALEPTLAGGRYAEMAEYFDRYGRDGLEGFGLVTSSAYLGFQALALIAMTVIAGWLLIQLSGLMTMRYAAHLGLDSRAKLAMRTAGLGPYGSPFVVWVLILVPLALVLSGLVYNWTFADLREAVDRKAPKVRAAEVAREAQPVLRFRVNEVGTAQVTVHRLRRRGSPIEVARHAFDVLPGPVTIRLRSLHGNLRPGVHRLRLAVRDVAKNRAGTKRLSFQIVRRKQPAGRRR